MSFILQISLFCKRISEFCKKTGKKPVKMPSLHLTGFPFLLIVVYAALLCMGGRIIRRPQRKLFTQAIRES